jgi:acetolactate synthase-1/2/3 large subunit
MISILNSAKHPIIITEEAGREPATVKALVALAEALGAPVFEAWQPYYMNFPRSHPLYGGVVVDEMPPALKEADVVLLVESELPWHPPGSITDKKVLVLGEDPLHPRLPFWGFRADVIGAGEVGQALRQLAGKVTRRSDKKSFLQAKTAPAPGSIIDTRWAAHELNAVLPENAIVVNETITHRLDLHHALDRLGPGGMFEASYGGLGVGIGLALGAKYAHPGRTVVCTIGDGAFHYNPVVGSFGAAQEHGLPLMVVLFNNAGYRSQKNDVSNYYPKGEAVKAGRVIGTPIAPAPDYAMLARAYGGYGERVDKPGAVRNALKRGLAAVEKGQLALIDLVLAPI